MEQLGSQETDFHEYLSIFQTKPIEKIPVALKSDKKNGYFMDIDIFVTCNWVVTRWQYTFTHTIHRTTQITTEQHK
jgi:hypothetical protein